ncbi:MAG: hypothetical protein ABFD04_14275 [Syntrophomonas sp.]
MPFQPKNVGEYPFKNCIGEVDAPLIFRFRKNFNSPNLNFNRFGLRGPEPAPDGDKKHILILGESDYFGAKLPDERGLWSVRLQKILSSKGHADWEVLNEGNPGYNTVQHRALWEKELNHIQPDILVLSIGINEVF